MSHSADRLSERVLVLRCQAGDDAAFEELVLTFSPRLRYYVRKMLRESHSADDILQDVWLQVFRGLPTLADVGAFRAWLYRITRDRLYREFRRPPAPGRLPQDLPKRAEPNHEATADSSEEIHAALSRLALEHREVLVLRYLEELPYEDIARVIGCPLGTVRSRIHYGRLALRAVLEGAEHYE